MKRFLSRIFASLLVLIVFRSAYSQTQAETLSVVLGEEEERNYPMGPIGGQYRVTDGATYAHVVSIDAGGPGAAAGLKAGDFVLGAFGKDFLPTGYAAGMRQMGNHAGVTQELGFAIERAEGGTGALPLQVLRPGTGRINLTVQLPRSNQGFSPLYLLTSAKYSDSYEQAVAHLHTKAMAGAAGGYFLGWTGLALLGHPDWDKTTGARPYRVSINALRDAAINAINAAPFSGTEAYRYDGNGWTGSVEGMSNWQVGQYVMFLSEYLAKTSATDEAGTRATVVAALQRGLEQSANSIQWWRQPGAPNVGEVHEGTQVAGMVGHKGVTGDYAHLGYALGINAAGTHTFIGFSFGRRASQLTGNLLDLNARPRDGHYFGYTDTEFDALRTATASNPMNTSYEKVNGSWTNVKNFKIVDPHAIFTNDPADVSTYSPGAGTARKIHTPLPLPADTHPQREHFDPSIHEKFLIQWNWVSIAAVGSEAPDELHTGYIPWGTSAEEDVGKTAGSVIGAELYKLAGGTLRPDEQQRLDYLKNFITRHYIWQQDSHAYCVGAQAQWAFALPFLGDRQLQYATENWSFYYTLSRTAAGGFGYMRARFTNDNYLDEGMCAALNLALPHGIARGNYRIVPGFNTGRIVARFDHPDLRWPTIDARYLEASARTVTLPLSVFDGAGNLLNPSDYTVTWSKVSGHGSVGFAGDQLSFGTDGLYRVKAVITRNGYTLEEPIDVVIRTLPAPSGYALGSANYQVYKNITGTTVDSLVQHHAFPEYPDISTHVPRAEGSYNGDSYGSRLSGLIVAPVAGSYRFYIASNDSSQLKLNYTGLAPADGQVVASVAGSVSARNFTTQAAQQSAAFSLTEGQVLAFEALHKEGSGGDHLSVAWSIDGGPIQVIEGYHLAHPVGAPPTMKLLTQPASVQGVIGGTVTLSFTTEGPAPAFYQWSRNGVPYGATSGTPTLTLSNLSAGMEGNYDCSYTTPYGTLTTRTVHVTVTDVGTINSGGLWREVYTGIGGSVVADLTAHAKYPYQADVSGVITSAMAPTNYADTYGQRITGWITPPTSGNYRFFIASDDESELWLSTDASPANAAKIVSLTGYKGDRKWSTSICSAFLPLVAGQKYFIQILHKEGGGGDNLAVAWQKEGDAIPVAGTGQIPGSVLSYRQGGIYADTVLNSVAPVFLQSTFAAPQAYATQAYTGFTLAGAAYDPNSADFVGLTFAKTSGPAWLTVGTTGALSGTPAAGDVGTNTFTVSVTDVGGLSSTATMTIVVQGPNRAPTFNAASLVTADATAWVPYSGQTLAGKASDPDSWAVLGFSKVSGPEWLKVAADGTLSGSAAYADVGTNSFTVRVTDEAGVSSTATLTIEVRAIALRLGLNGTYSAGLPMTGFTKGQSITLTGAVTKGFEVISKVDFLVDDALIASDASYPYSAIYTNAAPGNHQVKAVITTTAAANNVTQTVMADIFVDNPPQVTPSGFATAAYYPAGTVLGLASATAAPGRTINGNSWTLVSGNGAGAFSFTTGGQLTLSNPAALPNRGVVQLRVGVSDDQGLVGYGTLTIVCNPPAVPGVTEQRWTSRTTYQNQTWSDTPTYTGTLPTFTTQVQMAEETRRLTGLLQPPVSGNYTFWIASDDDSKLYLSSDESAANKTLVASLVGYTSFQNWKSGGPQSPEIFLEAGKVYYMEVLHFANGGGDHVSVGWQVPGAAAKEAVPATAIFPAYPVSAPAWIGLSPVAGAPLPGVPLTLAVDAVNGTQAVASVDFYLGANKLGSSLTKPHTLTWATPTAGTHSLTAKALASDGTVLATSNAITVVVGANNSTGTKLPNTIAAFTTVADQTYAPSRTLTITAPLASSGLAVTMSVKSGPATISGNSVTLTGAGTVILAANQVGDATYAAATEVTTSFNVAKATPLLNWTTPTAITYGTALSGTQLNATANVAGGFSYSPAAGAVLNAGSRSLSVTFTPTDGGNYTGASGTVVLSVNKALLTAKAENKSKIHGEPNPTLTVAYTGFIPGETAAVITGPSISTAAGVDSAPGPYTITLSGGFAANYELSLEPGTLTVLPKNVPVFTSQPVSKTVTAPGESVTFSASATGSPAPSYQWYFSGSPIAGATASVLTLDNIQPALVGRYWVVASNSAGNVSSSIVSLEIKPAGNSASHLISGSGYIPGGVVSLSNTVTYAGAASGLKWSVLLPPDWSFASSTVSGASSAPSAGQKNLIEWTWSTVPASPFTFAYSVNAPSTQTGVVDLVALVGINAGVSSQFLAQPDPLSVSITTAHSADLDQNGRISLLELTRVIELYNTRNGTTRTGGYAVTATTTEDGFVPAPGTASSAVVSLSRYHSADSSRDGKISLTELTRVIEIYNYRQGTTRTGQYKIMAGTEDGFSPGP